MGDINMSSTATLYPDQIGITVKRTLTTREKYLIYVAIFLFVLFAVFLGLFIAFCVRYEQAKGCSGMPVLTSGTTTAPSDSVCNTFECLQSAAYIARSINASVDPCQDFYQFACGRWVAEHPIPADASRSDAFKFIDDDVKSTLKELLILDEPTAPQAVKQAQAYFRSCEDVDAMDRLGRKPLLDLLNLNGSGVYPTLQPSWKDTGMTFSDIVEYLSTVGDVGSSTFISMNVWPDERQSDTNIITFTQTNLVLPSREMYLGDRNASELVLLENLYRQVLVALGANETTAAQDANDVVDFEIALANATEPPENLRDRVKQYHRMSLANLNDLFPKFDWLRYVRNQFNRTGVDYSITKDEIVASDSLVYYGNLFALVNRTSPRTLLNYGMWRHVYSYLQYLDKDLQGLYSNFNKILNGIKRVPERWKDCIAASDLSFPYAIGRLYVEKKFTPQDKLRMENIIDRLYKTFKEMLQEISWMTQSTKEAALRKLSFIRSKIGYPDFILNDTALNAKSEMYQIEESNFFGTNLDIIKKNRILMLKYLRKPVDRSEWLMSAPTVNAYYNPANNEIVFPAGILNPPFYSGQFSNALIYGAIGMVVAHEITHGFDDQGSAYDENGNLRQWWNEEDLKNFKSRAQCLVDQYSTFVDRELNIHVNGFLSLGENIADCGGIKGAFRAYRSAVMEKGREEDKYPSLPYTQDQLFFIGFSQLWCSNVRPELRKILLQSDPHSPNYYRVLGPLQNSEDFGKVFNCPVGTPMNPQHKCQVW